MKGKRFEIRLTESELLQLEKKAAEAGVPKSTLLCNFISDRPILDKDLTEQLRALTVELARIGNNINQIAYQWNKSGSNIKDIDPLFLYMAEIRREVREVRNYCYSSHK